MVGIIYLLTAIQTHQTNIILTTTLKIFHIGIFMSLVAIGFSSTFYVDPMQGDISNDGTQTTPWSTLEEVLNNNLIESYKYSPVPYTDSSELVLKNAGAPIRAGDTIVLMNGLHGVAQIDSYINASPITIIAAEGHEPIIDHIRFRSCKNWRLIGVHISSEPYGYYTGHHLVFVNSHSWHGPSSHIDIISCKIYSGIDGWNWTQAQWLERSTNGIYVLGDSVNVRDCVLTNIDMGISILGNDCDVTNNEVINFSGDGIRPLGARILIEGNLIKNCFDIDDNHDDGIQSFNLGNYDFSDVIIRNNIILNFDDPDQPLLGTLQGIGCFDGPYHNWVVENNLVYVNHWHGITFSGAYNCNVINNTVIDPTPDINPGGCWIMIGDHKDGTPSAGCIVKNNISNKLIVDAEESHNILVPDYPDYEAHFEDYINRDFHLKALSAAIDAGDTTYAPAYDLDDVIRPQGLGVDIGAYEYKIISALNDKNQDHIKIYPNPCQDYLIFDSGTNKNSKQIELRNANGLLMKSRKIEIGSQIILLDTQQMESGFYFLQVDDQTYPIIKM